MPFFGRKLTSKYCSQLKGKIIHISVIKTNLKVCCILKASIYLIRILLVVKCNKNLRRNSSQAKQVTVAIFSIFAVQQYTATRFKNVITH